MSWWYWQANSRNCVWLIDRRDENGSKYFDNEMIEDDDILDKMKNLEFADLIRKKEK